MVSQRTRKFKNPFTGDVAEFREMVILKEDSKHMEKLDNRWLGLVLWLGKSDRGHEHLMPLHGGMALTTGRSIRSMPMRSRWSAEAVLELQKLLEQRRKYITNQVVDCVRTFSDRCNNCTGLGRTHSENHLARFENIWEKG